MAKKAASPAVETQGLELDDPALRIALLLGPDMHAREEAVKIIRAVCDKQHGDVDTRFYPGDTDAAIVLDECRSMGLIAQHKLIVVDEGDKFVNADSRPALEKYASKPAPGATLIIRSISKLIPGKFGTLVNAVGRIQSCEPPTDADAVAWLLKVGAKRAKVKLEPAAAELMVAKMGPVLAMLATELEKLAVATGDAGIITPDHVKEFTGRTREESAFAIQDKLLSIPPSQRLDALHHLIHVNRESPIFLIWVLAEMSRKLYGASHGVRSNMNEFALKGKLKLFGPGADTILAAARTTEPARCFQIFRACVDADKRCKSGFGDPDIDVLIAALRFPAARRP
jgi:DNA polymerase III delta subunit